MEGIEISPGAIVEYLHSGEVHIGCVVSTERHITVVTPSKRIIRLSRSRFLPWQGPSLPPSLPREEIIAEMEEIDQRRQEIKRGIDTQEIWSLIQEEIEECDVFWLAELIWEERDINRTAALGRALLEDKLHFKFHNPLFRVFSPSVVENKLRVLTQREREEELVEKGNIFFRKLWEIRAQGGEIPPIEAHIEKELKEILKKGITSPENRSFQKKWKRLTQGIPPDPHLPLLLAQAWKMVPRHYNFLLDQADYRWGDEWSRSHEEEIKRQIEAFEQKKGLTLDLPFISIDSATTRDIDDAFYVEKREDVYLLYLAFACPVIFWDFSSPLNREVAKRTSSLYLPEGTSHMLPEVLGTEIFSLHRGEKRPALILKVSLSNEGQLMEFSFSFEWITLAENLTYSEVEELLKGEDLYGLYDALSLARELRKKRLGKGAVIIERQEPVITISPCGEDVHISLEDAPSYPSAQMIVSEFMILANTLSARWTNSHPLPLIFRTQDIDIPREAGGVWKDPLKTYGIIKLLSATTMETTMRPHASLGVEGYAPITSPLRRYIDFLNVYQIYSSLTGGEPLPKDELNTLLPYLNLRLQEANKIQKYRVRYWKLLYLKRYCKKSAWRAVVVDEDPQAYTFLLPREQLLVKAPKNMVGGNIFPGKEFLLRFQRIDPLNNQIKIQKIEEV